MWVYCNFTHIQCCSTLDTMLVLTFTSRLFDVRIFLGYNTCYNDFKWGIILYLQCVPTINQSMLLLLCVCYILYVGKKFPFLSLLIESDEPPPKNNWIKTHETLNTKRKNIHYILYMYFFRRIFLYYCGEMYIWVSILVLNVWTLFAQKYTLVVA